MWFSQTHTRNPAFCYMQEDNSTSPLTTDQLCSRLFFINILLMGETVVH